MDGALAMHVGFQLIWQVALSTFLSHTSSIYQVRYIKDCCTPIWRVVHTSQFNTYFYMCAVVQKQRRVRFKHSLTLMCVDCILWITWVLLQNVGRMSWDMMLPALFMCHGDRDTLVPMNGASTHSTDSKQLGVHGEFHIICNLLQEMKEKELRQLCDQINWCLLPHVWLQGFYIICNIQFLVLKYIF
jgi:hypothetical protein